MFYKQALDFITTATADLTPAQIEKMGTPLVPAGTRAATEGWTKRLYERRTVNDGLEDWDSKEAEHEVIVLGLTAMMNVAAAIGIVPRDQAATLTKAFIAVVEEDEPDDKDIARMTALQEDPRFVQLQFDIEVEGTTLGSAMARLGTLMMARYLGAPCPIVDAEAMYKTLRAK